MGWNSFSRAYAGAICAALCACAPASTVRPAWRGDLSLRSMGADLGLAHVDPGEVVRGKVSRNLDYVSIAVERVSFPELPASIRGNDVALGFDVRGLLPGNKSLKAVAGLLTSRGAGAGLYADQALFVEQTLYSGRVVEVHVHLQAVPADDKGGLRSLLVLAGQSVRRFVSGAEDALDAARSTFLSIFENPAVSRPVWSHVFRFNPADTIVAEKPESLFTAARHILIVAPSEDAQKPRALRSSDDFRKRLKLEGSRLVDRTSGLDYHESPYIVLSITKFKRATMMMARVTKAKQDVESALASKNADLADSFERTLREEIVKSGLSMREKHLEETWRRFYQQGVVVLRGTAANDAVRVASGRTCAATARATPSVSNASIFAATVRMPVAISSAICEQACGL